VWIPIVHIVQFDNLGRSKRKLLHGAHCQTELSLLNSFIRCRNPALTVLSFSKLRNSATWLCKQCQSLLTNHCKKSNELIALTNELETKLSLLQYASIVRPGQKRTASVATSNDNSDQSISHSRIQQNQTSAGIQPGVINQPPGSSQDAIYSQTEVQLLQHVTATFQCGDQTPHTQTLRPGIHTPMNVCNDQSDDQTGLPRIQFDLSGIEPTQPELRNQVGLGQPTMSSQPGAVLEKSPQPGAQSFQYRSQTPQTRSQTPRFSTRSGQRRIQRRKPRRLMPKVLVSIIM